MSHPVLVLASASPRRQELLMRAGVPFEVAPAEIDESPREGELPVPHVERLAVEKAAASSGRRPDAWVLAADTIVVASGRILGKPVDRADARSMLTLLAGRTHEVVTSVCLRSPDGRASTVTVSTEVDMRALSEIEMDAYVTSGEWQGKAGGYAAQGIAAAFIHAIRGSYTSVVGLPLSEVVEMLANAGAPAARLAEGLPA